MAYFTVPVYPIRTKMADNLKFNPFHRMERTDLPQDQGIPQNRRHENAQAAIGSDAAKARISRETVSGRETGANLEPVRRETGSMRGKVKIIPVK